MTAGFQVNTKEIFANRAVIAGSTFLGVSV
jgi:hypothetical protein